MSDSSQSIELSLDNNKFDSLENIKKYNLLKYQFLIPNKTNNNMPNKRINIIKKQITDLYDLLSGYENNQITENDPKRKMKNEEKILDLKEEISKKEQELSEEKNDLDSSEKTNKLNISGNGGIYINDVPNTKITINKKNISKVDGKGNYIFQDINTKGGNIELNVNQNFEEEYANLNKEQAKTELKKVNKKIDKLEREIKSETNNDKKNILIVTASPKGKTEQDLINQTQTLIDAQKKHTDIYNKPESVNKCNGFSHIKDLVEKYSNNKELEILHLSVHGDKEPAELFFEDKEGFPKTQSIQNANDFFELINDDEIKIKYTVISACYSNKFAQIISKQTKSYSIGMNNKILSTSAVNFLRGFYNAIMKGKRNKIAFKSGLAEIGDEKCNDGIVQKNIPELYLNGEQITI